MAGLISELFFYAECVPDTIFFTVFILLVTILAAEFLCATPDLGTTIAAKPIAQLEGFFRFTWPFNYS